MNFVFEPHPQPRLARAARGAASLGTVAALVAALPGTAVAQAAPLIELQVAHAPAGDLASLDLSGTATLVKIQFRASGDPLYTPIGSFAVALTPGGAFGGSFIPTDPCVGAGSCPVGFVFSGFTGAFETFAFAHLNAVPGALPASPPVVPVGSFMPGDPCIGAGVCRAGGPLVAFAGAPFAVGSWDVAIQAAPVPEPASAVLSLFGLGAVALARRRALRRE